jgi:hypothetical protein
MCGVPLSFTTTASSDPSQFVAIFVVGDGSGCFLIGTFFSIACGDSKSFKQATSSSAFDDPAKTIP